MTSDAAAPTRPPGHLLVVAAAGYGKTAALEAHAGPGITRHPATDLEAALDRTGSLPFEPGRVTDVVVDDVDQVPGPGQRRLLRALAALPAAMRLSLAAREPLDAEARASLRGLVYERGPADLALSVEQVAAVLRDEHAVTDAALAADVHEATAGWPALVHLAGDAHARGVDPGTAAAPWASNHVLAGLPAEAAYALDLVRDIDVVFDDLVAHLDPSGAATAGVAWLRRTGLVVQMPPLLPGRPAPERVVPVIAGAAGWTRPLHINGHPNATATGPTNGSADGARLLEAARWYERHGEHLCAARVLLRAGETSRGHALLVARGREVLAAGGAAEVVGLLGVRPRPADGPQLQRLRAEALRMSGEVTAAKRAFAPLVEQVRSTGGRDAGLAWRVAMVHYSRGEQKAALAELDQIPVNEQPGDRDEIELEACRANVLSMLGRDTDAERAAQGAVAAAEVLGDDAATAAAHLAAANASTGERAAGHLVQALAAAERAGDVVQAARALVNQAHQLLTSGRYLPAYDVSTRAVRLATQAGPPGVLVIALDNLGQAAAGLGRYEEAVLHFERSLALARRCGLERTAFALVGLAEVQALLGRWEQSRAAFTDAACIARANGEVQVAVRALAGLARLSVEGPVLDLPAAREAAEDALGFAPLEWSAAALVACGRVALASGDAGLAERRGAEALVAARTSGAVDTLAHALELRASTTDDPTVARASLDEALTIWRAAGAEPGTDRVTVLLGGLPAADGSARAAAREARRRLLRRGVRAVGGLTLDETPGPTPAVDVQVLGGFTVRVAGQPVPIPAWKSRQARTLVKVLASRRGRPVGRTELCELLWPDDDPARTAHRLSVLLSVVRSVMDPQRAWPPDQFIAADLSGVRLDRRHVCVDAEQLLQDAAQAAALLRAGDPESARHVLAEVDLAYRGDAFEDEPYEDWAVGPREEVRAAWLRSLRALAREHLSAGDDASAAELLVRLLVADPYDASSHQALVQGLVRDGRHGEARRAYDRWTAAMRAVGAAPPDPGVLRPTGPASAVLIRR